jgi:Tfp pilus assembly protein PilV
VQLREGGLRAALFSFKQRRRNADFMPEVHHLTRPAFKRFRNRVAAQDGLTLVEVAVTALMVGLISLSLVGLDAAGRTTADQRRRAQAFQVAQADQERIKGLSADQIASLNQTRTVTMDGVAYTVTSTGQFLNSAAETASCASGAAAADYAKVVSTVDWASNNRADIVVQSTITPRAGGALVARVLDQNANPLPGVRVDVAGADQSTDAVRRFGVTDAEGCVIFGTLLVGDYNVSPTLSGYVDPGGDSTPSTILSTTAGNTTSAPFTMGQAGRATVQFETTIGGNLLTGQNAPSVSWFNSGMPGGINRSYTPSAPDDVISTPMELFPFYVATPGNYAGNYNVWAGDCMAAQPPAGPYRRMASVAPGSTWAMDGTGGHPRVALPALDISVTYNGNPVKPDRIELTNSCGENWRPPIDGASSEPATGWLDKPGQPYGTYSICADYDPPFFSRRKATLTSRPNTNFADGTPYTVAITNSTGSGSC